MNHDKSDARELAQRLDRYVAGNRYALATVRVPTPEEEQARIRSRQREQLKRELQRISAQGRSLLLSQGYREKGAWWKTARWETLRPRLPDWLTERLDVFCRLIASLNTELNQATAELSKLAPATRPLGMGGLTYETIEREVGDWNRFHKSSSNWQLYGALWRPQCQWAQQLSAFDYKARQRTVANGTGRDGLAIIVMAKGM